LTAAIELVTDAANKPNGLCFSPDYKKLYLCDTGTTMNITVWDVVEKICLLLMRFSALGRASFSGGIFCSRFRAASWLRSGARAAGLPA
jgi:hypothetical protein